jgi:hypothetical protein
MLVILHEGRRWLPQKKEAYKSGAAANGGFTVHGAAVSVVYYRRCLSGKPIGHGIKEGGADRTAERYRGTSSPAMLKPAAKGEW